MWRDLRDLNLWFSQRVAALLGVTRRRSARAWVAQGALAIVGVAGATLVIGVTQRFAHISDSTLLYLPVVLWLAARYGRWPAILASVCSFLAYDYFFIPPLHEFTVGDLSGWISLVALLATALTLGHLTALVRARAQEAEESQRQTDTLYHLAQVIADAKDERALYAALTAQALTVFAVSGLRSCALLLPGETGALSVVASAAEAVSAAPPVVLRRPLTTPRGSIGALTLEGTPAIVALWPEGAGAHPDDDMDPRVAALFSAMCDQMALAIERAALAREASHAAALRESDKLKDALLGLVTHDLRTPLASIKAAVSSLLRHDIRWDDPERRELLESIDSSADRLNRLVGDLLDLSRLEAGVAQPEFDWMLISDVIAAALDRLELAGQLRGAQIQAEEPESLPLVLMDHVQIEQTVTNLIENALKYSPPGSPIRVRVSVTDTDVAVSVSDQGMGIPSGELEAIFTKFYRVRPPQTSRPEPPSARPPVGAGLGLAICAGIIRAHGGRIWAESAPGQGATFTFTLPLASEQPGGALPEVSEAPGVPEQRVAPAPPEAARSAREVAG
ncbi:MAG TPA: ATP-binding protein [Ktedonobacterales bacterium]